MKPKMRVSRCCCGAAVCEYCIDTFNRSDSSDIDTGSDCGWTEESGNPAVVSNELSFPAAGLASCTTTGGTPPQINVLVDAECASTGDTARIVFNFVDTSNYDYFEMKVGASFGGSIRLVSVASGTHTTVVEQTSITVPLNVQHFLCLSYTGDIAVGTWIEGGGGFGLQAVTAEITSVNGVVGLATDSGCLFDDFTFQKHATLLAGCGDCPADCAACSDDAPVLWIIDIESVANTVPEDCPDCADATTGFNQRFIIPFLSRVSLLGACLWRQYIGAGGTGQATACESDGDNLITITMEKSVTDTVITVVLSIDNGATGGGHNVTFFYGGSGSIEACRSFNGKDIPWDQDAGAGHCDGTSATCSLTAVV